MVTSGGKIHNVATYTNQKCRCDMCRVAWSAYTRQRNAQRKAWTAAHGLPGGVVHGYSAYINWKCRCEICTQANTLASFRYYHRRKLARSTP